MLRTKASESALFNSLPRFALVCEMFNFSLSKINQKGTITVEICITQVRSKTNRESTINDSSHNVLKNTCYIYNSLQIHHS